MVNFKLDMSNISKGLMDKRTETIAALGLYGDSVAKQMEAYAKNNRPWQDRTGMARQALHGTSKNMGVRVRCEISHGVDYGICLEMCNERRYAILKPTIDAIGPKALSGLSKIFK